MSVAQRIAELNAGAWQPTSETTARHWFATPEAFAQVCSSARAKAHAPLPGRSEWDQEFAASLKFRQLLLGLAAPLREVELRHVCRIAGVPVPSPRGAP